MPSNGNYLLGIDPGRAKCGLALVHLHKERLVPLYLEVISVGELERKVEKILAKWEIDQVILGDGTGNKKILACLAHGFSDRLQVNLIDERNSSYEARIRYWQENPPRGLWRLIPCSLRVPPEPYDHYVALILVERYLHKDKF